MPNTELESLVRIQFEKYFKVAWLITGDPRLAAQAVEEGFQAMLRYRSPQESDARKALAKAALGARRRDSATAQSTASQPLCMSSPELVVLIALDWAGLNVKETAHLMRQARGDLAALRVSAIAGTVSLPNEDENDTALRLVDERADALPSESTAQRNMLLNGLRESVAETGPPRTRYVVTALVTLTVLAVVGGIIWTVNSRDQSSSDDVAKERAPSLEDRLGDAEPPPSLTSIEELSDWVGSACKQPGGDFEPLRTKSITGELEGQAQLILTGPNISIDDQSVSRLMSSPAQEIARFCFAIRRESSPDEVDWYATDLSPSALQNTLTLRPRGVGYFVVAGPDKDSPFGDGDPEVECPEAQVAAQSSSEILGAGSGLWQVACGVGPNPATGTLTIKAAGPEGQRTHFPVENFTEVPLVQTLRMHP